MYDNQYLKAVTDIFVSMGVKDWANYIIFDNPICKTLLKPFVGSDSIPTTQIIVTKPLSLPELVLQQGPFLRIAGISGALAVILGAYGSHKSYPKSKEEELRAIYLTANRFHFFHTLALLGVPMCKKPALTGSLMIIGMLCFTGPCYYHAFCNDDKFGRIAPIGGTILILAWLSMIL